MCVFSIGWIANYCIQCERPPPPHPHPARPHPHPPPLKKAAVEFMPDLVSIVFLFNKGRSIWEANAVGLKQLKGSNCPVLYPQPFYRTSERKTECRRKAVRHDGGTGFRLAVDSLFSFVDFLQPLRFWLEEWYVTDLFWGYVSMLVI